MKYYPRFPRPISDAQRVQLARRDFLSALKLMAWWWDPGYARGYDDFRDGPFLSAALTLGWTGHRDPSPAGARLWREANDYLVGHR